MFFQNIIAELNYRPLEEFRLCRRPKSPIYRKSGGREIKPAELLQRWRRAEKLLFSHPKTGRDRLKKYQDE
ncbi:MAG TPA: hypothetical protein PK167_11285, partial [Prolixibacteraceae bacterium]|nr:hypothetical protein [Prolixibacteraceae bacterium]